MPWPKGRPRDAATKAKISAGNRGQKRSSEFVEAAKARAALPENKEKYRKGYLAASQSKETRLKASASLKKQYPFFRDLAVRIHTGRKRSNATRAKLRAAARNSFYMRSEQKRKWWAGLTLEQRRKITANGAVASRLANPSSIELLTASYLRQHGIRYVSSFCLEPYILDFYLPDMQIAVECDGDYWHNLPGAKVKDSKRDSALFKLGVRTLRLTESDIRKGDFSVLEKGLN